MPALAGSGALLWELIADPDDPATGIIMRFATAREAEAFLTGSGYQPAGAPVSLAHTYEKRTAATYTHPASSPVIVARRRLPQSEREYRPRD